MVKQLNSNNFEDEILNSEKPVLVDFFAEWCGPCKRLAPVLEELSGEPIGKQFDFAKINIDESDDIAHMFGVMSIPTMILFKSGEEQIRMVGVQPKDAIANTISDFLN